MNFGDFPQASHQLIITVIRYTAAFDKQREMPFILDAFHPAIAVAVMIEMIRLRFFQAPAETVFNSSFTFSKPRRSTVYLNRAFLRTERLP